MSEKHKIKKLVKNAIAGPAIVAPPIVHDPNPLVKKTIEELRIEYNNVFLIRCPYCRGSGKTYMWDCTACKTHGIVDSRTFKYPEPQSNPAEKKVN